MASLLNGLSLRKYLKANPILNLEFILREVEFMQTYMHVGYFQR